MTSETASVDIPDEIFDADFTKQLLGVDETDRIHSLITSSGPRLDPVVEWRWTCPECNETGTMADDLLDFGSMLHGSRHAKGPFDAITPLTISMVRQSETENVS
jgi:hypothetical protein